MMIDLANYANLAADLALDCEVDYAFERATEAMKLARELLEPRLLEPRLLEPGIQGTRAFCPAVKKVVDNNPVTVVFFEDGTKAVVKCSQDDVNCLETAILYAIVKRTFGYVDPDSGEVSCPGLGNRIRKIVSELTVSGKKKQEEKKQEEVKKAVEPLDVFEPKNFEPGAAFSRNRENEEKPEYVRPDKPFSQFTQEEKRAYWRWQKSKNGK